MHLLACKVKRRSTCLYQSPTSLLDSISGPPVDDSWFFCFTVANVRPTGFLCCWPVGLVAWNSLPDNMRDPSVIGDIPQTFENTLFALYWSIQRIRGFTKMRYTKTNLLLTYFGINFLPNPDHSFSQSSQPNSLSLSVSSLPLSLSSLLLFSTLNPKGTFYLILPA